MKTIKGTKGITLIALVVTIIVLLILAGIAISMLSGSNGILNKAAEAKVKTDEATAVEQAKLAVLGAMNTNREIDINKLNTELGTNISKLPADVEMNGQHIAIGKDGTVKTATWYYDNNGNVTNGKITLNLGDTINYNATIDPSTGSAFSSMPNYEAKATKTGYESNQTITLGTNPGWMVMGVENGEILIVATTDQTTLNLGTYDDIEKGKIAYEYGAEEVNNACSVWGKGKYASGGRSVQIEDLDRITGYDKTTYGANQIYQYGNKVTYSWTSTAKKVESSGTNGKTGNGSSNNYATRGFTWYDEVSKTWKNSIQDTSNPKEIGTITSTYYGYYGPEMEAYNTTLGAALLDEGSTYYWLGSSYVYALTSYAIWGVRCVDYGGVYGYGFVYSDGDSSNGDFGLRPAVSLKSDVELTPNGDHAWKLPEN